MQIDSCSVRITLVTCYFDFRDRQLLLVTNRSTTLACRAACHIDPDEVIVMHFVVRDCNIGNRKRLKAAINLNPDIFVVRH